jgi:hypothetical protein
MEIFVGLLQLLITLFFLVVLAGFAVLFLFIVLASVILGLRFVKYILKLRHQDEGIDEAQVHN